MRNVRLSIEDLAVSAGAPAFDERPYLDRLSIGNRERLVERINSILDTRWASARVIDQ